MKYDLKAMDFDPDKDDLTTAFTWEFTPDGSDYWSRQFIYGITPEGQAKWDAMKQQWNEENCVERNTGTARELNLQVGDVVEFAGDVDTVISAEVIKSGSYTGKVRLHLKDFETGIFDNEQITVISRASDTTPQRYVVECYGITTICTREEAEKLAAGGVDAVYKLGDKVSVTAKVELS